MHVGIRAVAAAVLCCLGAAAQAQQASSVNIYGLLDVGLDYNSNVGGKSQKDETTGILAPNILGFKGEEDLGGGHKAFFQLETQFAVDTGTTIGSMWGRHALVGLKSATLGSVQAGTVSDFMFDKLGVGRWGGGKMFPYVSLTFTRMGPFSRFMPTGSFDYDRVALSSRINNAVRYDSPDYNGFSYGALYGFGEQSGGVGLNNTVSLGASYLSGPWTLQAAGTRLRRGDVNDGRDGLQTFGAGGRYDFANGSSFDFLYTNAKNTFTDGKINSFEMGYLYPTSANTGLIGQYTYMKGNDVIGGAGAHQINTSFHYKLSMRTRVYASYAWQKVVGGDGLDHAQIIATAGQSSSDTQGLLRVGLFHAF